MHGGYEEERMGQGGGADDEEGISMSVWIGVCVNMWIPYGRNLFWVLLLKKKMLERGFP